MKLCPYIESAMRLCLRRGDNFDFYQGVLWEARDLHGGTGRRGGCEIVGIDFVHGRKFVHVFQEYRGLDYVMKVRTCGFENSFDVFQNALGLLLDIARGHLVRFWIERYLP